MSFANWLRNWMTPSRPTRQAPRWRPRLEALEDRAVPAILNVTTPIDVVDPADGLLSLREAVLEANVSNGADTIVVPAGTYTLDLTDDYGMGGMELGGHVTLRGTGPGTTVLDAAQLGRVFKILPAAVATLAGMTITGGGGHVVDLGGGIFNEQGTLTLTDCTVTGNAVQNGAGIYNEGGTVTIRDSFVSGNSAQRVTSSGRVIYGSGGGILNLTGTVTIQRSTVSHNTAGWGGGIDNFGSLTVSNSTISGNAARATDGEGGGIRSDAHVYARVTINGSTISGNFAQWRGGGISIIGSATVNDSTFTGNSAVQGGGIFNWGDLTIRGCTLSDNSATCGGGIFNFFNSVLTVNNSTISRNSADLGGGIYNARETFGIGETVYGTVTVRDSTVLGNTAELGGDVYNLGLLFVYDSVVGDRYDA